MRTMNRETYFNVMNALRAACDARAEREISGAKFAMESELFECASVTGGKVYLLRAYGKHSEDKNNQILIAAYGATNNTERQKGINTHPYLSNDIEHEMAALQSQKQREGYEIVRILDSQSDETYALQEISERDFFAITPAGQKGGIQTVEENQETVETLTGIITGGGWEHDAFRNSCARVHITLNAHHLVLFDDTERGWALYDFDGAANPDEEFKKVFGVEFGEDAEFDYAVLSEFVRTLERVGSEFIADVYRGKPISLRISNSTYALQLEGTK
ncbi:hypothetical protein FBQ82_01195 [Anaerolineae bacterium CFX7]|nr:hypothetical protein [Anaerolineae bacterium CFX7]